MNLFRVIDFCSIICTLLLEGKKNNEACYGQFYGMAGATKCKHEFWFYIWLHQRSIANFVIKL